MRGRKPTWTTTTRTLPRRSPSWGSRSLRSSKIHPASEQAGQLTFEGSEADQTDSRVGEELHKEVYVAVRAIVAMQYGAEERQSSDAVAAAELGEHEWIHSQVL
jgi:hypothetical protein